MKNVMAKKRIASGTIHKVPADLRKALVFDSDALAMWNDLTPLARNEWICWTVSVEKAETRRNHVERVCPELKTGKRRPCCWLGCLHRADAKGNRRK
jgi:uncharacterized protein YdeI (YjbR/CyaY-like superfamily)